MAMYRRILGAGAAMRGVRAAALAALLVATSIVVDTGRTSAVTVPGANGVLLSGLALIEPDGTVRGAVPIRANGTVSVQAGTVQDTELSPDGTRVVFAARPTGGTNLEIFVVEVSGNGLTRLTTSVEADFMPTWAPNGSKIAFVTGRSQQRFEIFQMNSDGSGQSRVGAPLERYEPQYSPDGTKLAFLSTYEQLGSPPPPNSPQCLMDRNCAGTSTGAAEAYRMSTGGGSVVRVTHSAEGEGDVSWSPDMTELLVARGNAGLFRISPDGAAEQRFGAGAGCTQGVWSPDGTKIACLSEGGPAIVDVSTETVVVAPELDTDNNEFSWANANPAVDYDGDGIAPAVEAAGPNGGDGNFDGEPDADQLNVASLPSAVAGAPYVTIESSGRLLDVTATAVPASPAPPPGVSFPVGIVGFTIAGVPTGRTVSVGLYLPPGTNPTTVHKYQNGSYVDFTSNAIFDGDIVFLQLTDGGAGDADGQANGTIVDPVAIGVTSPDGDPPTLSLAVPVPSPSGWQLGPVRVQVVAEDPSGVASIDCAGPALSELTGIGTSLASAVIDVTAEGSTAIGCTATDSVGNGTGAVVATILLDSQPPSVTWTGDVDEGDQFVFGDVPAVPTCTATDPEPGSGAESCEITGWSTAVGSHTLVAIARDVAGNQTTATRTYTVAPWELAGFYQPVDMSGTVNVVKARSTVPLKFEIFRGLWSTPRSTESRCR